MAAPADVSTRRGRLVAYGQALFPDDGLLRLLGGNNFHWLDSRAARSGQPLPGHLRRLARRHGLQTVVSLRSPTRETGALALERAACEELGLTFTQVKLRSSKPPPKHHLHAAVATLEAIAYPALFHCKSGVDRSGLMASLYLHLVAGWPIAAVRQFRLWPYLHVKGGPAGILDRFLAAYACDERSRHFDFLGWVDNVYDPQALATAYRPARWSSFVTKTLLRRE